MRARILTLFFALALPCWAADEQGHDHDHDHEGHDHEGEARRGGDSHAGHGHSGPPPEGLTFTSLALTAGGGVLVSAAFLAILWKPIDGAFRRSRFRDRWQTGNLRIGFAVGVTVVITLAFAGTAYVKLSGHGRHEEGTFDPLKPRFGGVAAKAGDYVIELVARRTGEVRFYMFQMGGKMPTSWDIKPTITVPATITDGGTAVVTNQVVPMKVMTDGSHFVTTVFPFQDRRAKIHLSVKVKEEEFELDYDLPVQD